MRLIVIFQSTNSDMPATSLDRRFGTRQNHPELYDLGNNLCFDLGMPMARLSRNQLSSSTPFTAKLRGLSAGGRLIKDELLENRTQESIWFTSTSNIQEIG